MKKLFGSISLVLLAVFVLSTPSYAYMLGEESKGTTIKINEQADMTLRVMLQPRFDYGDLIVNQAGTSYEKEGDHYFRRARLYVKGNFIKNLKYNLTLEADKWGKTGSTVNVGLYYAYLRYHYSDILNVEIGKHKLPYSG